MSLRSQSVTELTSLHKREEVTGVRWGIRRWLRSTWGWVLAIVLFIAALVVGGVWWEQTHGIRAEVERAWGQYYTYDFNPVWVRAISAVVGGSGTQQHEIRFNPGLVSDEWLRRNRSKLEDLSNLQLRLWRTRITDAGIAELRGMEGIVSLDLRGTKLTDASVDILSTLPQLYMVNVARTGITGTGLLKLLSRNPRFLGVDSGQLSDECLRALAKNTALYGMEIFDADDATVAAVVKLPTLEVLKLRGKNVTNKSLPVLKKLTQVQYLELINVNLSDKEITQLKQALAPNCRVVQFSSSTDYEHMLSRSVPQ